MRCWASFVRIGWRGMPRGSGASSLSHSSLQAVRSMRAGLPVSERDRSVPLEPASIIFFLTVGSVSASSVVSQTDPHHTPAAPRAIAAAICLPRPMPPAPRTGTGAMASTISGMRTIVPISPVWPPASAPWAMMMSAPALTLRSACERVPASAATFSPASWQRSIMSGGGGPRALAIRDGRWARAISTCLAARLAEKGASTERSAHPSGRSSACSATPYLSSMSARKSRWPSGMRANTSSMLKPPSPSPAYLAGTIRSTP